MKNIFNKKNTPLIIGFSLPLLMILLVAISIYVPGIFLNPEYNFLYSTDSSYGSHSYTINNGILVKLRQPRDEVYNNYSLPQLYVHDVKANKSTPISFNEAKSLKLDSSIESPDGYKVENSAGGGGFFPFSGYNSDYYAKYLTGHNLSKRLALKNNDTTSLNMVQFLGWVIK